jgi:hypothetical protein
VLPFDGSSLSSQLFASGRAKYYDRPLWALGVFLFRLRAFIGSVTEAGCVCAVGSEVQNMPPCTGTPFDVYTVLSVGCFQ